MRFSLRIAPEQGKNKPNTIACVQTSSCCDHNFCRASFLSYADTAIIFGQNLMIMVLFKAYGWVVNPQQPWIDVSELLAMLTKSLLAPLRGQNWALPINAAVLLGGMCLLHKSWCSQTVLDLLLALADVFYVSGKCLLSPTHLFHNRAILLQVWSRVPQIWAIWKRKDCGQLSLATMILVSTLASFFRSFLRHELAPCHEQTAAPVYRVMCSACRNHHVLCTQSQHLKRVSVQIYRFVEF